MDLRLLFQVGSPACGAPRAGNGDRQSAQRAGVMLVPRGRDAILGLFSCHSRPSGLWVKLKLPLLFLGQPLTYGLCLCPLADRITDLGLSF